MQAFIWILTREKLLYALFLDTQSAVWGGWADAQKLPAASQAALPGAASALRGDVLWSFPSEACHCQGEGRLPQGVIWPPRCALDLPFTGAALHPTSTCLHDQTPTSVDTSYPSACLCSRFCLLLKEHWFSFPGLPDRHMLYTYFPCAPLPPSVPSFSLRQHTEQRGFFKPAIAPFPVKRQ